MDNQKMGLFISELRKSKQMTQKSLAEKLNITDKAVSKWERGLSCPDISILSSVAEILGVTTNELLNGEKSSSPSEEMGISIDNALQYADKTTKSRVKFHQNVWTAVFTITLLMGAGICAICDMAVSGAFTWSLYPISSIAFGWLVLFPVIKFGGRGVPGTLVSLSVFLIPFLYVLDQLVKVTDLILPIGIRMSFLSILFLWIVFALFRIMKGRKQLAGAISLLLAIPLNLSINLILSKMVATPIIDIWDVLTFLIVGALSVILFFCDFKVQKNSR